MILFLHLSSSTFRPTMRSVMLLLYSFLLTLFPRKSYYNRNKNFRVEKGLLLPLHFDFLFSCVSMFIFIILDSYYWLLILYNANYRFFSFLYSNKKIKISPKNLKDPWRTPWRSTSSRTTNIYFMARIWVFLGVS